MLNKIETEVHNIGRIGIFSADIEKTPLYDSPIDNYYAEQRAKEVLLNAFNQVSLREKLYVAGRMAQWVEDNKTMYDNQRSSILLNNKKMEE